MATTVVVMDTNKTPGGNDEVCKEMKCPELYKQDANHDLAQVYCNLDNVFSPYYHNSDRIFKKLVNTYFY